MFGGFLLTFNINRGIKLSSSFTTDGGTQNGILTSSDCIISVWIVWSNN